MPKDHAYLYLGSVSEARRNNELDDWRMSHKQNILCKEAVEDAIRKGFDGMHLDQDCARSVIEEYGFKRVGWVLAATLQQKKEDGRFSPQNKEWAASTFIPQSDRNHDFTVQSHPAVLDGFVNQFRKEQEQLQMFDRTHCTTMTGEELEGKVLVMSPYTLKESYWAPENQLWLASGASAAVPLPLAERCTPPASVMESIFAGTVRILSVFWTNNTCLHGHRASWPSFAHPRRNKPPDPLWEA